MEYFDFIPEGWNDKREIYELDSIKEAYETGKTIQGFVDECDSDCNLYIKLGKNLTGIIPRKEVDLTSCDELGLTKASVCRNKLNSFVQFKVKEIPNNNVVILSRKKANEEALDWMINNLHVGMVVKGIVRNMRKYGAFVEIGAGVVGLLHIEDISVSRIKSPEDRFVVGQKIDVAIKSIDKKNNQIVLSYKELLGSWDENVEGIQEKQVLSGIVRETDKYKNGIFIEIKPNLVGLAEYKDGYYYGQRVDVFVKKIIKEKKKIKLLII